MRMLSLFDMDVLLRNAGAERVGEDASRKLGDILEDRAKDVVFRAKIYARHAGRNTVTREDIMLAAQT
ncbi:Archaeal histone HAN1 subunit A [Candidatus Norongarragalina meridionalis]|nr:Archaeal histone HAN1 subunit A [Candidatus Norongarragalina meridionalis]